MPRLDVSARFWRFALLILIALAPAGCADKAERYARHVARGQELVKEGKDTKAALEFKTALQSNPAGTEANYQLGMIAERLGDWPSARAFFTKVTDQDPKHVPALLEEGRIALMSDDADGALTVASAALSLSPGDAQAHALRGAALLRQNQLQGAEREAAASLKIAPNNGPAIAVLAGIRTRQGQPAQALDILDRGIKANPADSGLKITKIKILDDQGNRAAAEDTTRVLIAAEPKVVFYRFDLARRLLADNQVDAAEAVLRDGVRALPGDYTMELALVSFLKERRGAAAAEAELAARVAADPKAVNFKFVLADLYFSDNKKDPAQQILRAIIEKDGTHKDGLAARIALARYAIAEGKMVDAKPLLKEVLQADGSNGDALLLRARLAVSDADYPAAIADLRSALRNSPNFGPALVTLARVYTATGEDELSADFYQRALDADPANTSLRIEYAGKLSAMNQPREADDQLRLVLAQAPDNAPALFARANVLASQQRWAEAATIAQSLTAKPGYERQAHALLGQILVASKQYPEGIAQLKQALASGPSIEVEHLLAVGYLDSGDSNAAREFAQSIVAARPNDAAAYQLLGDVKARLGSADEAKAAYERSIALNPLSVSVRLALGNLLAAGGDHQSAARVFAEGAKNIPRSTDLRFASALAEDRLDHFDAARAGYEAVLKLQPHNVAAANNLAVLIADAWPKDKALLEQARRLSEPNRNSTNPALLDTLGWVQFRLGNRDDALALLRNAATGDPKDPQIRYHLGLALLASGFSNKARSELTLSVASNTPYRGLDDARRALQSN